MAEIPIVIVKFEDFKDKVQQEIRDIVFLEFGAVWEEYCFKNNIPYNTKMGFLDYLSKFIESV